MNTLLDWAFGFTNGTFATDNSGFGLATPLPNWAWPLITTLLAILIWQSYQGQAGPRWLRTILAATRWSIVILLIILGLGPQIEQSRTLREPDRVIVLLDASGSMNMPEINPDGTRTTRAQILHDLLADHTQVFEQLATNSTLDVYSFTDQITKIQGLPSIDPALIAESSSTSLARSIQTALTNAGTNPISGIVVFSDGQSNDQPSPALIQTLLGSGIPIFTIPIGSPNPVHDASIRLIESPNAVFAKDRVPVRVHANINGYSPGDEFLIELIDQPTGQTLASRTQTVGNDAQIDTQLSYTFPDAGKKSLLVRITPINAPPDLILDNNQQPIELQVISEPMRLLYIDGQPRWEYRYLKNILMRETTINATTMLLASDRRFIEEGHPLNAPVPRSLKEWEPFDVVILGDVRPDLFSNPQLKSLKEHIETHGGALLWIAGEGATPSAWTNSTLAPLLPMQTGKENPLSNTQNHPTQVVMQLTKHANRAGILSTDEHSKSTETPIDNPDAGWTILRWTHSIPINNLKPGVTILANARPLDQSNTQALVTTMRYGRGQIGFVGTDEIWRWRYGRGEDLPEQFWLPLIRTLARGTIARRAATAGLILSPNRPTPGTPVRTTLQLYDNAVIQTLPTQINATITPLSSNLPNTTLSLSGKGQRRTTLWTPNEPGVYSITVAHPLIGTDPISKIIRVSAAWDESNNPNTDHPSLASLSNQTNGQLLTKNQLHQLPNKLPNRTRITTLPPKTTPLWDRPIVLIVLIGLLSIEWIGRRSLRLA